MTPTLTALTPGSNVLPPASSVTAAIGGGFREAGLAAFVAFVLAAPMISVPGWAAYRGWSARDAVLRAEIEASLAHEKLIAAPAAPLVDAARAGHGRDIFAATCAACHGPAGLGMPSLGRNLVESDFVAAQDDASLAKFLAAGRPDAKPSPMPPRAGRPDLTDADLADVALYLRGLQDPRRLPALPPPVALAAPELSSDDKAKALAAAGGDAEKAEYIIHGTKLFNTTCIACHGAGGVGIKGNGKPLVNNEFVQTQNDEALLAFVKRGRDPSDPKNTTGVQMPPKGGNPALSDDDLLDVIDYLRTLQPPKAETASAARS